MPLESTSVLAQIIMELEPQDCTKERAD